MMWPEFYLLCFAIGALWAGVSLLLGGAHLGHLGHSGGGHFGHAGHAGVSHGHAGSVPHGQLSQWATCLVNPSCLAVFLVWFGGSGYLLTRHSGWGFWINTVVALVLGFGGAAALASVLRFLNSREQPLNPADYEMAGVLGQVSCPIRPDGVGEVIYVLEGTRRLVPAKSEDGAAIGRGEEVVVTRYEKGIAYVRTWAAMLKS